MRIDLFMICDVTFLLHVVRMVLQVLGFFLGIVHCIDACLAYVEHRKFKVQIIQGNVVNNVSMSLAQAQASSKV